MFFWGNLGGGSRNQPPNNCGLWVGRAESTSPPPPPGGITLAGLFGPAAVFPGSVLGVDFGVVSAGQLVSFPVVYWNPVAEDVLDISNFASFGTAVVSTLSVDRQDGIQSDTSVWLRTAICSCVVVTGGTLIMVFQNLQAGAAPTAFGITFNAVKGWNANPLLRLDGSGAGAATAANNLTAWGSGAAVSSGDLIRNSVRVGVLAWNAGNVDCLLAITGGLFLPIGVVNNGTLFEPGAASYKVDTAPASLDALWSGVMLNLPTEGASATQVIYREG